ncbi:hypothetical protein T02_6533 [Trichinella nativa]|uniref:Uncharacterized protein n=1 Tax=Trichinella nativa TaxID=6335 RepID=A0A0V1KHV2_9BILA|nr:hypothetical protein T02_6533 [Trichinella nativa]
MSKSDRWTPRLLRSERTTQLHEPTIFTIANINMSEEDEEDRLQRVI